MIKKLLFKVCNDSFAYPVFYVEAIDILEALKIAKNIVDSLKNDRVIVSISIVNAPILRFEEEN